MIKLFKGKFYVSKTNIFSQFFNSSHFFLTHLTLETLLITWGRLQNGSSSNIFQFSKLSSEIIQGCHGPHTFCSALFISSWRTLNYFDVTAIKSCSSCSSRGLPVSPLVNDLQLSAVFGFFLHTSESVLWKFWHFFCLYLASLFNLCKRLIKQERTSFHLVWGWWWWQWRRWWWWWFIVM